MLTHQRKHGLLLVMEPECDCDESERQRAECDRRGRSYRAWADDGPNEDGEYVCALCWRVVSVVHTCDNPIHCSECLSQKATKATARRSAAKRAAAKRKPKGQA